MGFTARLLMKEQVTEKGNKARAGGIRDSAASVCPPKTARAAGARFRRCLYEVLRQPDVLEEMIGVVETLGTEARGPRSCSCEGQTGALPGVRLGA